MTRRTDANKNALLALLAGLLVLGLTACHAGPSGTEAAPTHEAAPTTGSGRALGEPQPGGRAAPTESSPPVAVVTPVPPTPSATATTGTGGSRNHAATATTPTVTPGADDEDSGRASHTPTPRPGVTAVPTINAYLHAGPDTYDPVVGNLLAGKQVDVLAISEDGLWLYVKGPSVGEDEGWVYINLVTIDGDPDSLPVR